MKIPRPRVTPDARFSMTLAIAVAVWRRYGVPEDVIADLVRRARGRW